MKNDLIFDIGMHVGQDTEFYLKKGFRVIAVEANPLLVAEARVRFQSYLGNGRLIIHNEGIAKTFGSMPFYVNKGLSQWSSFDERIGNRQFGSNIIEVKTIPLSYLLGIYGAPYYLKIDIEGYDGIALESLFECSEMPRFISCENGPRPMLELLKNLGYKKFQYVSQKDIFNSRLPKPPKEGKYVEHRFIKSSSGPFGNELAGEWVDYDTIVQQSYQFFDNKSSDSWYDVHATY